MCNHKIHKPQSNHKRIRFIWHPWHPIQKAWRGKKGGGQKEINVDNLKKDVFLSSSGREEFATKGGWNR